MIHPLTFPKYLTCIRHSQQTEPNLLHADVTDKNFSIHVNQFQMTVIMSLTHWVHELMQRLTRNTQRNEFFYHESIFINIRFLKLYYYQYTL